MKHAYLNSNFNALTRHFLKAILLLMALQTQAQPVLDGHLLGQTEGELRDSVETLAKVHKPKLGPHGLRGLWSLPKSLISGLPFETVFFIAEKRVQRIEQRTSPSESECKNPNAINKIFSAMDARYGTGLSALDTGGNEVSVSIRVWEAGIFDAVSHFSQSPHQCALLIIYKWHEEKNASSL